MWTLSRRGTFMEHSINSLWWAPCFRRLCIQARTHFFLGLFLLCILWTALAIIIMHLLKKQLFHHHPICAFVFIYIYTDLAGKDRIAHDFDMLCKRRKHAWQNHAWFSHSCLERLCKPPLNLRWQPP